MVQLGMLLALYSFSVTNINYHYLQSLTVLRSACDTFETIRKGEKSSHCEKQCSSSFSFSVVWIYRSEKSKEV